MKITKKKNSKYNNNKSCVTKHLYKDFFQKLPNAKKLKNPSESFLANLQGKIDELLENQPINLKNLGDQ